MNLKANKRTSIRIIVIVIIVQPMFILKYKKIKKLLPSILSTIHIKLTINFDV